jgi:hypothetical protein
MQHTSIPLTLAFGPQGCMDEVKGRILAACCLAELWGMGLRGTNLST